MHKSSMNNMKKFRDKYVPALKILDVGSRNLNGCYKELFPNCDYIGFDIIPGRNVDVSTWDQVSSGYFDIVISGQAFEHIEHDLEVMKEIVRVLKSGGICCIIAPSKGPWHCKPDYRRYSTEDLSKLAQQAGLKVIDVEIDYESHSEWDDCILIAQK